MITWTITRREHGLRLLDALTLRIPAAPKTFLRQLCRKQRVLLNGRSADAETRITLGDKVGAKASTRLDECITASGIRPDQTLYEDRECIVLDKPAGLLVHPAGDSRDDLLSRLRHYLKLRGERFRTAAVHRLDVGTSGPVLFGKGTAATRALGQIFMDGRVEKGYLTLVEGTPPQAGRLVSPVPTHGRYRAAVTRFRRLGTCTTGTLLELRIDTGRRHQIRRQMADAGWPLTGDRRYGSGSSGALLLHCSLLAFQQPFDETDVHIVPPLPPKFIALFDEAGILPPADIPSEDFTAYSS